MGFRRRLFSHQVTQAQQELNGYVQVRMLRLQELLLQCPQLRDGA